MSNTSEREAYTTRDEIRAKLESYRVDDAVFSINDYYNYLRVIIDRGVEPRVSTIDAECERIDRLRTADVKV